MKEHVVVQAGGKGTHLEYYCWNKPKCLVPVNGKPLLYHLFDTFPDTQFHVIIDYKADVLRRYVEVFPPAGDVRLVIADGVGTCGGIASCLAAIPDGAPFWLVWSDLFFNERPPSPESDKPVVFLSRGFPCRWSAVAGEDGRRVLVEVRGTSDGVMGLFWFPEKSFLAGLSREGEFVHWLSAHLEDFGVRHCDDVVELGTLNALQNHWDHCATTRFFNRITFQDDRVVKEAMVADYAPMIDREIAWYERVSALGFANIPALLSRKPLTLARIDGQHPYQIRWGAKGRQRILHNILDALDTLHGLDTVPAMPEDLRTVYLDKTLSRIRKVERLVPELSGWPTLRVNGVTLPNILHTSHQSIVEDAVSQLTCGGFTAIHGDPTFSNIIIDQDNKPWFIDPRGAFANDGIHGDPCYDWAKLYYSVVGNYDNFNRRQFVLSQDGRNVEIEIRESGWLHLRDVFRERFGDRMLRDIRILHGLIWLALSGWVDDDYDSILAAYYNGLYYLTDALNS